MKMTVRLLLAFLLFPFLAVAQMWNGVDTLYGNEWIDFNKEYYKIPVAEDGIYRISYEQLQAAGIPTSTISADQYQLFRMGEEVPLYLSSDAMLGSGDFIEFYGQQNKAELDRYLFKDPDNEILNPNYSLFTDTSAYFLTWAEPSTSTDRYASLENDLSNLPAKEDYYWHDLLLNFTTNRAKKTDAADIRKSAFNEGEGYGTSFSFSHSYTLNPDAIHAIADSSFITLRMASNARLHDLRISLNEQAVVQEQYFGYELKQYQIGTVLSEEDGELVIDILGQQANNDRYSIANINLRYPRRFDFQNANYFSFTLDGSLQKKYVEIENFDAGTNSPIVYDVKNRIRLTGGSLLDGNLVKLAFPATNARREIILANSSTGIRTVDALEKMEFINFQEQEGDFIFITHQAMRSGANGTDPVQEYADYRSSEAGGSFDPIIIDIEQLYEQFAYGIHRHSLSIRNFGHFVKKYWQNPQFLFIVGKAVEYQEIRTAAKLEEYAGNQFFIPTFGAPGADNLLLSTNETSQPIIPVGRLAAVSPSEVTIYLNKVKDFDENNSLPQTQADKHWMKRIIHLGGGDLSIQGIIKTHLSAIETVIEDNEFGAEVNSFYKNSSEPIQISQSEQILNLINSGVSIITFFGHSGSNTFDFSLDSPDTYENQGKYPVMISLGCYSGQIHGTSKGISERFLFEEDKGAIAFFASTSLAFIHALRIYSEEFYQLLGSDYYGLGLGNVSQAVIRNLDESSVSGIEELTQQFTLHGDPALVLNAHPGPDYVIDGGTVQFDPPKINVELDSFDLNFDILNIGSNISDSITVEVTQVFPNRSEIVVARREVAAPSYSQEMAFTLPVFGEEAIGQNRFKIKLDVDDQVAEAPAPDAEFNNVLVNPQGEEGVEVFFVSNEIRPVFPPEYAIIGDRNITLKANSANPFAEEETIVIELDTSMYFNSPDLQQFRTRQSGGVIKWTPDNNWMNDQVYYWRISPDSVDVSGYSWRYSSFIFRDGDADGWNQSHFFQLTENKFRDMEFGDDRKLKFLDDIKDVGIVTGVYPNIRPEIAINSTPHRYIPWDGPIRGGLLIAVLDSVSLNPLINDPVDGGDFNSVLPSWATDYGAFAFSTREAATRAHAMYFLDSVVQKNEYVIVLTVQETNTDYEPAEWAADSLNNGGRNLFQVLEEQGASMIRSTATSGAVPYYFVYKKDDPDFDRLESLADPTEITSRSFGLTGSWDSGNVESGLIGPASSWDSFKWELGVYDFETDVVSMDIIGIRPDSTEMPLAENVMSRDTSLAFIAADSFPYLRLRFNCADSAFKSAADVDYWRVYYTGIPEMALNPARHFTLDSDTLQQGARLSVEIGMENLSTYDMDSLLVRYKVVDESNEEQVFDRRIQPLLKGDSLIANFDLDTRNLVGPHSLIIEANPDLDQPELFDYNNIGLTEFFVDQDKRNPLLDVTFDGVRIMNGDLVSAKPFIIISLEDENPYLPLADTSLFNLFLKYPFETELRPLAFDSDQVQFFPALESDLEEGNEARIELRPELLIDGTYELVVQAEDVTGNQSGRIDYKIAFQVINKSMISNVFNYPNPFSTSTQFVYTLTGDKAPEFFKIQIMTVSGRIVKEITQAELGPLQPGTHRTEYTWDGTDEYGDRLANGVYLYQIITRDQDGNSLDKYNTGTDRFFYQNIGKLVILR